MHVKKILLILKPKKYHYIVEVMNNLYIKQALNNLA